MQLTARPDLLAVNSIRRPRYTRTRSRWDYNNNLANGSRLNRNSHSHGQRVAPVPRPVFRVHFARADPFKATLLSVSSAFYGTRSAREARSKTEELSKARTPYAISPFDTAATSNANLRILP